MKRKETVYKGLEFISVYFEDTSLTSPDYFQITEFPTRLTAGKNLFKLRGHPSNLRVGGVLNLEVLDYNGDPIYTEVVDYIDEDKSRVIAIYIYSETSPGDCTITLLAEAQTIQGAPVPTEWQGRANVKWSRTVPVNPNVTNDSEIIFAKTPLIEVSEQVGVQLDRIYSGSQQFPTYTTGQVRYFSLNGSPAIELIGGQFTSDMASGTITVLSPANPTPTPNYTVISAPYVSTIKKILSSTTALLDREYTVFSSQSIFPHTYTEFAASAYSLTYEATPTYIATQNSQSFALMQIKGLDPATGDISRIKVYTNNKGTVGTWELVNDVELEETEIFVSATASLYPDQSIGIFTSQSIIDAYWDAYTYAGPTTGVAPTLQWATSSLNNAMVVTSSVSITNQNSVFVVQNKPAYDGVFIATSSYKVTIDALGIRLPDGLNPKLSVYISGSAVDYDTTDYFNQELPRTLGKRIGEIEVTSDSQRFDDVVFNFESNHNGTAALLFVIEAGKWQIADIRTTTDNDDGFSPNYTRIRSIINTPHKANNQISFKVEYYNSAGVKSKQTSYLYDNAWQGGNRYIDGDYSMLTGSLYVADSLESGVAISGYKNTGFVRSLGYEGFAAGYPGFLLWSGSALAGSAGTKGGVPYSGVGLELYANTASYFRYATNPSEIDVRTDKFFFGNPNTAYISGSNGVLEISSSNFLLSSSGDVFANDAIFSGTALANVITNKMLILSSSNSGSYLQSYSLTVTGAPQTAYRLRLDGTLGGDKFTSVRLDCSLLYPLGEIILPSNPLGDANNGASFNIINNFPGNQIYNLYRSKGATTPLQYDIIDMTDGGVYIFTKLGIPNYSVGGTEILTPYLFRRTVTIGDGNSAGGRLTITGSFSTNIRIVGESGAGASTNGPAIILQNQTYNSELHLRPTNTLTTSATQINRRFLGNLGPNYSISPLGSADQVYMAVSSSADGSDRRIGIGGALHTAWRESNGNLTVSISDHTIVSTVVSPNTQTITLPIASGEEAGRQLVIMKQNSTGTLTIAQPSSTTIVRPGGGTGNRSTTDQYAQVVLYCDGNGLWYAQEWGTWT